MSCYAIARMNLRIAQGHYAALAADAGAIERLRRGLATLTGRPVRFGAGYGTLRFMIDGRGSLVVSEGTVTVIGELGASRQKLEELVGALGRKAVRDKLVAAIRSLATVTEFEETTRGVALTITT